MSTRQGDVSLLNDPVAQELLQSTIPTELAYIWPDGTPRVTPIWFHWNGEEIVLSSPPNAPKVKALSQNPKIALTINRHTPPYKVLLIRGTARLETLDELVPEYAICAYRYLGEEEGRAAVERSRNQFPQWVRISIRPEWVGIIDFDRRLPSVMEATK